MRATAAAAARGAAYAGAAGATCDAAAAAAGAGSISRSHVQRVGWCRHAGAAAAVRAARSGVCTCCVGVQHACECCIRRHAWLRRCSRCRAAQFYGNCGHADPPKRMRWRHSRARCSCTTGVARLFATAGTQPCAHASKWQDTTWRGFFWCTCGVAHARASAKLAGTRVGRRRISGGCTQPAERAECVVAVAAAEFALFAIRRTQQR